MGERGWTCVVLRKENVVTRDSFDNAVWIAGSSLTMSEQKAAQNRLRGREKTRFCVMLALVQS